MNQPGALESLFSARVFRDPADGQAHPLPYRLLCPPASAQRQPLVLFLHGVGERGHDNRSQLLHGVGVFATPEVRARFPCFLVAPQCPEGLRWVERPWDAPSHRQPRHPSTPLRLTLALLQALRDEFPIDERRLYVTGLSMGGYGTWDAITRHPREFAAAVPICGGGDETLAARLAALPIWAFHGAEDDVVPVQRSRNMIEAVHRAGGTPRYTEYPGIGHASWEQAYREPGLLAWLFAQQRG